MISNRCLGASAAEDVRESAKKLKDSLDRMKDSTAKDFRRLVESYREHPLTEEEFSEVWISGIANRTNIQSFARRAE